jgi:PPP family 3-phenylpropionic acid transporter
MSLFIRLSSSYFWYFAILGLVVPFLPIFLDGKGFSSVDIGETLAIVTASRIVGPSLWAMLADKTGKQLRIIQSGALLAIASFCFLFWLHTFWSITFCLAVFSLFWTAILPQMEVMTLNSVRKSAKIYARIRLWGSIGFIVLAVVGGDILERFSPDAFTYLGAVVLFGLFISTLFLQQPRCKKSKELDNTSISNKIFQLGFVLFFAAGLMLQMSFGPYYGFFALFLRDLNYPGIAIGLLIGLAVVAEIAIFIFAGQIFKRFAIKSLLIFSIAITAFRWLILALFGDDFWLLSLSQLIHAASFGIYHSASMQFIHQHFDNNQQSRGQALYIGGVYGLGGAIGAYIAGLLWQGGIGAQNAFYFAAITAFIGVLFALFIPARCIKC